MIATQTTASYNLYCIRYEMKLDNQKVLVAIVSITLVLFPVVAFTTGLLRIGLGFLFVIFFPGYTLLSALFPRRDKLSGVERIALSFGLSIAVVPLIGLILNYTPWGIKLYPILVSITFFIIAMSAIGWYRQQKLTAAERRSITLKATLASWMNMTKIDKVLSILLVVAVAVALGSLGYATAIPEQYEKSTEFYILNAGGKAGDYPRQVTSGEPVDLVIGIVNNEHQPTSYQVKITISDIEDISVNVGTLGHKEKYEERVSFIPQAVGKQQRVDFYLYKNGRDEPYFEEPLHLYIDVIP